LSDDEATGFANRKVNRQLANGLFPFVRFHKAEICTFEAARTLTLPPTPKPAPTLPRAPVNLARPLKTIQQFHEDPRYEGDYSRADFAYAIYAHSNGIDESTIIESILSRDMSKKGNAAA
jgi:hypothetical protein